MADNGFLINYDWRVSFEKIPTRTQGGYYSIFDILFDQTGNSITAHTPDNGMKLDHDIICYDTTLYEGTSVKISNSSFNYWAQRGLDIIPVKIDPRAIAHTKQSSYTDHNTVFTFYSKDAIIKYNTVEETMKVALNSIKEGNGNILSAQGTKWMVEGQAYIPCTISVDANIEADIILSNIDNTFNNIYATEGTTYVAYNRLYVSPKYINNILKYYASEKYGSIRKTNAGAGVNLENILTVGLGWGSLTGNYTVNDPDPDIVMLLKNLYVFIRAPIFADYILPEVFNQNLTEDSDVKHSNILLAKDADFHRYEDRDGTIENSRFYHVQTAPSIDLLSENYVGSFSKINHYGQNKLLEDLASNFEKLGSPLYDNINQRSRSEQEGVLPMDLLSAPQYYDPESPNSYNSPNNRPVIVPKNGNLYIEGRIFGPVIDEIWRYFKQVVSGRIPDGTAGTSKDNGYIYNTNDATSITQDTSPTEGQNIKIHRGYVRSEEEGIKAQVVKTGDPISSKVEKASGSLAGEFGQFEYLDIDAWVNPPDQFKLQVYEFLKAASKEVLKGDAGDLEATPGKFTKEHDINGLAPENNTFKYTRVGDEDTSKEFIIANKDTGSPYKPRTNPYSLRELEAMLANTKYNINALMSFLVKNYTVNGSMTYGQSGLFQFHKDYNSQVGNPNTLFKGQVSGIKLSETIPDPENMRPNAMSSYGIDVPDTSDLFRANDVYLAADGTWQYIGNTTRIRVFNTEY